MGGVGVAGELQEVDLYALAHEVVLLAVGEEADQGLNGVGTLFVSDYVGDVLVQALHDFESLGVVADTEKLLDHVVCVLVSDQFRQLHV